MRAPAGAMLVSRIVAWPVSVTSAGWASSLTTCPSNAMVTCASSVGLSALSRAARSVAVAALRLGSGSIDSASSLEISGSASAVIVATERPPAPTATATVVVATGWAAIGATSKQPIATTQTRIS